MNICKGNEWHITIYASILGQQIKIIALYLFLQFQNIQQYQKNEILMYLVI